MQQQIAAFIMRHIHKILYLLAVKSTATRKKRHRIFGSVSFTYTGRKETAQLVCSRRRRKAKKKHSKSHHLKREELSINQSTNMVVVCSIWSAETKKLRQGFKENGDKWQTDPWQQFGFAAIRQRSESESGELGFARRKAEEAWERAKRGRENKTTRSPAASLSSKWLCNRICQRVCFSGVTFLVLYL